MTPSPAQSRHPVAEGTPAAAAKTFTSRLMTGPTITVTMIHGGRTRNAVADDCTLSVDFRVLPGMPRPNAQALISSLAALGLELTHGDLQVMTPPLATAAEDPFARPGHLTSAGT